MDINNTDKEILKQALKEIIQEDAGPIRTLFKEIVREVIIEQQSENHESRRKRLESYIDADFEAYDEVFKALA